MIAYHCYYNAIIAAPFKSCANKHRLLAYNAIMQHLRYRKIVMDLQMLDNEASAEYKLIINSGWRVEYQLVPPRIDCINAAERSICTFKEHFLSVLDRKAHNLPKHLWELILPQAD